MSVIVPIYSTVTIKICGITIQDDATAEVERNVSTTLRHLP
jgi:hypothetical protein